MLQLQDLICEILQGHLVMFGSKESFLSVLSEPSAFLWLIASFFNYYMYIYIKSTNTENAKIKFKKLNSFKYCFEN